MGEAQIGEPAAGRGRLGRSGQGRKRADADPRRPARGIAVQFRQGDDEGLGVAQNAGQRLRRGTSAPQLHAAHMGKKLLFVQAGLAIGERVECGPVRRRQGEAVAEDDHRDRAGDRKAQQRAIIADHQIGVNRVQHLVPAAQQKP
ncbi:MAG: hypothetical protein B7Z41_09895 [Rhizobiales bacterium 12-66-7]|nr:MAG: hypothetical protein B7Z41_09895 [Rhizobiales bacterium 12-66-7]